MQQTLNPSADQFSSQFWHHWLLQLTFYKVLPPINHKDTLKGRAKFDHKMISPQKTYFAGSGWWNEVFRRRSCTKSVPRLFCTKYTFAFCKAPNSTAGGCSKERFYQKCWNKTLIIEYSILNIRISLRQSDVVSSKMNSSCTLRRTRDFQTKNPKDRMSRNIKCIVQR